MTQLEVDFEDFIAFPIFAFAVAISTGLLTAVWFGFDLSDTVIDLGAGHTFSVASVAALLTLGYVAATNEWETDALTAIQIWIVVATVALIIAPPFLPILEDTLAATPAGMIAFAVQMGGYITFSYTG